MSSLKGERKFWLDLLRILAGAMVVMIHCSGWFGRVIPDLEYTVDTNLFGALSACAVPLFFMISGALLLSPSYDFSLKKLLWKLLKIIVILVAWGMIFALAEMKTFSFEKLFIWTFKGHFHMWFFEYLIGVYLLIPLFRPMVQYGDGSYMKWFLVCWLIFGILKFTLDGIPVHSEEIHIFTGRCFMN